MSCKKIFYKTRNEAKQNKKKVEDTYWKKFRVYKCPNCWWYHFTAQKKHEFRKKFKK